MYRRKHKHKLRFARVVVILVVLGGLWWIWQKGETNAGILRLSIDPEKLSRSVGNVLGAQIKRVSDLALQRLKEPGEWGRFGEAEPFKVQGSRFEREEDRPLFKFAVIADSHEDSKYFPKILDQIRAAGADFLIHSGDLSNAGELSKLQEAKKILDGSGVLYAVLPGDHDYYGAENFVEVFNQESREWMVEDRFEKIEGGGWNTKEGFYFGLKFKGATLVFLDSSDNQDGISEVQFTWLKSVLEEPQRMESQMPTFIFTQAPPSSPYFPEKQIPNGADLLKLLAGFKIDQVFAGNTHSYARYPAVAYADIADVLNKASAELDNGTDTKENIGNSGIEITTVGAVGTYKNFLPMWTEVVVFEDGGFTVEPRPLLKLTP